jgi:hypothetical protein
MSISSASGKLAVENSNQSIQLGMNEIDSKTFSPSGILVGGGTGNESNTTQDASSSHLRK